MRFPVTSTSSMLHGGPTGDAIELAMRQHRLAARRLGVAHLGGRPSKYNDHMAELAYAILTDHRVIASLNYVAAMLGISRSTLYEWQKIHEDFQWAIFCGKAVQECFLASCLVNEVGNPQGILLCLYHLHGWRRNGRPSEDGQSRLREALEVQAAVARRVEWDRSRPDALVHVTPQQIPGSSSDSDVSSRVS